MRRPIKGVIVVAILAAAGILISLGLRPKPVAVSFWEMKTLDISETVSGVATGFIEPAKRVFLQPEIAARIKEIKIKRGDRVKTGETLVVLDDLDFKDQLRALDAALPLFEARVKQARAHAAQLRLDYERAKKIFDGGSLAGQQFELAKMALDLGVAELEAAESAFRQAQVNREVVFSSLRKTRVLAPFDGRVLDSGLEVGQLWSGLAVSSLAGGSMLSASGRSDALGTAPGVPALISQASGSSPSPGQLELIDDSQLFACLDIDENDFWKLKLGQTASLVIDALAKRKLSGTVVEIYPFISRVLDQNRTARVKIRLADEARADILPGMSVNIEILISSRKGVLAAPTAAIFVRPKGKIVYRVADGVLRETAVETGMFNWEWSEILSGLKAGDRIARPPEAIQLKDGLRVVEKDHGP
ncbi:MAG: efflux RND transporter periplasmic adaptor subunit [Candidatus Aminicenantes bacterium]|nr:efflux RND transporter periplasmic adaptor subunit [Candidatus Aminicenantes bacterium]